MSVEIEYVSEESFAAEVSRTTEPILLDFTADWCEPCEAMAPVIEQISQKYTGKLRVLKVDLDECADIATQFEVWSIPTLIFLSNGKPKHRLGGARSYRQLVQEIETFLGE
jgi:thioredoxin 1